MEITQYREQKKKGTKKASNEQNGKLYWSLLKKDATDATPLKRRAT
jgi:hypothetical protein